MRAYFGSYMPLVLSVFQRVRLEKNSSQARDLVRTVIMLFLAIMIVHQTSNLSTVMQVYDFGRKTNVHIVKKANNQQKILKIKEPAYYLIFKRKETLKSFKYEYAEKKSSV